MNSGDPNGRPEEYKLPLYDDCGAYKDVKRSARDSTTNRKVVIVNVDKQKKGERGGTK